MSADRFVCFTVTNTVVASLTGRTVQLSWSVVWRQSEDCVVHTLAAFISSTLTRLLMPPDVTQSYACCVVLAGMLL